MSCNPLRKARPLAKRVVCGAFLTAGAAQALAAEATDPRLSDINSTWVFINQTTAPVSVVCKGDRYGVWVPQQTVAGGATFTRNLNRSWGDGMGFPEPQLGFTCQVSWTSQKQADVRLTSLEWGDHVRLTISDAGVSAQQQSSWTSGVTKTTFFKAE